MVLLFSSTADNEITTHDEITTHATNYDTTTKKTETINIETII